MKKGFCLSAFFVMFDFAMSLTHKLVHNFFGWSFVHCTALPIIISVDGSVRISNDKNTDEDDCVVVFAWGNAAGKKESALNTRANNLSTSSKEGEERDALCKRVVRRLSSM